VDRPDPYGAVRTAATRHCRKDVRALRFCRVRPVNSRELALRRYGTYCLADPVSGECRGPMSVSADRMIAQLERMQIWPYAEKYAKKDLVERK